MCVPNGVSLSARAVTKIVYDEAYNSVELGHEGAERLHDRVDGGLRRGDHRDNNVLVRQEVCHGRIELSNARVVPILDLTPPTDSATKGLGGSRPWKCYLVEINV